MPPCPEELTPPALPSSHPALWVLAGLLLTALVYDAWAWHTGHPTISQGVKRVTDGHRWWKLAAAGVIGLTLWHLLLGGPL